MGVARQNQRVTSRNGGRVRSYRRAANAAKLSNWILSAENFGERGENRTIYGAPLRRERSSGLSDLDEHLYHERRLYPVHHQDSLISRNGL